MSSYSSNIADVTDITPNETPNVPWEVVRWTKLRKIEGQAFSEIAKRKFGTPTVLAVFPLPVRLIQSSGVIAIGTSKGLVLIFDFRQSLKHVIGIGTKGILVEV
jgi:vacuolar protein sorting-associated protein 8